MLNIIFFVHRCWSRGRHRERFQSPGPRGHWQHQEGIVSVFIFMFCHYSSLIKMDHASLIFCIFPLQPWGALDHPVRQVHSWGGEPIRLCIAHVLTAWLALAREVVTHSFFSSLCRWRTCGLPSPQMWLATWTTRTSATSSHTERTRRSKFHLSQDLHLRWNPHPSIPFPPLLPTKQLPCTHSCPRWLFLPTKRLVSFIEMFSEGTEGCGGCLCVSTNRGTWDYFQ